MVISRAALDVTGASLGGLRVLVTRPRQQADKWTLALQSAGATTVSLPLLEIAPYDEGSGPAYQALKARVLDLDHYQHAIFVSQNAVRCGLRWIDQYWPQPPLGVAFYAVGSATAALLRDYGLAVVAADGSMNSETLLQLPSLQQVAQQRVLIFRGSGGRPLLAGELARRGARVDYCELYERRLPAAAERQLAALAWCRPGDVVAVHSGETLTNLCSLVSDLAKAGILSADCWRQLPLLVPGERVAAQAAQWGFRHIITAPNAADQNMLAALQEWRNRDWGSND